MFPNQNPCRQILNQLRKGEPCAYPSLLQGKVLVLIPGRLSRNVSTLPSSHYVLMTDTSLEGWGAHMEGDMSQDTRFPSRVPVQHQLVGGQSSAPGLETLCECPPRISCVGENQKRDHQCLCELKWQMEVLWG